MNWNEADFHAEELLLRIRRHPGDLIKWHRLVKKLNIDQMQIIAACEKLAEWDYRISIRKSAGVTFYSAPDVLTEIEIHNELETELIGKACLSFRSTKSTNDVASELAEQGAVEGTIVTAEEQTAGRGRLGRSWFSPAGTGIYLSIILRPTFPPERAPGISVMTALALAKTLTPYCPGEVQIKWPNDVLLGGKKTAGILTELNAERGKINYLIVGVGINVNHGVGNFPEELRSSATSLRRVLKRKVPRVKLLQEFLKQFEREYDRYQVSDLKSANASLKRYSSLLGRDVTIKSGEKLLSGRAVDIDSRGCLILDQHGTRFPISAGEVTVVKK